MTFNHGVLGSSPRGGAGKSPVERSGFSVLLNTGFTVIMGELKFCTYIIFSEKLNRYYIGSTDNFERRLDEHNAGVYDSAFTVRGIPWEEKLVIRDLKSAQAFALEKHFKSMKSRKYLENLFKYPELVESVRKRFA